MNASPQAGGLLRTRSAYICRTCRQNLQLRSNVIHQRRGITKTWIAKTEVAAEAWQEQAKEIRAGRKESMLSILEERGYINAVVGDRDKLDDLMTSKRVGAYVGIDPTAPSLHLGHLLPLMSLFWMYVHGFHALSLIGGATAQIGDPTGRTTAREPLKNTERKLNIINIHLQLKTLWVNMENYTKKYGYEWEWAWRREIANNNTWMNNLSIVEFLKLPGTGFRMGTMLGRDTVKNRMEQKGGGMSYAEFSYPVLQAWDFWQLYNEKKIQLQIGGADQYGNILAGVDAVKHIIKTHYDPLIRREKADPLIMPMGFTTPLLTTATGAKLGKSEGNAIWLGKDMLSTFELYQHFIRLADADVGRHLKLFTFIPLPEIDDILTAHHSNPKQRIAQHRLARDVVELVHGHEEAKKAIDQHALMFPTNSKAKIVTPDTVPASTTEVSPDGGSEEAATAPSKMTGTDDYKAPIPINASLNPYAEHAHAWRAPTANITLPKSLVYNQPIARVLYAAGLVASRSEGHRLASKRGAYIASRPGQKGGMPDELKYTPVMNWAPEETQKYVIDGGLLVLRVGKWKVKVVKVVEDEEFEQLGLESPPGWEEHKMGLTEAVDPKLVTKGPRRFINIRKDE